MDSKTQKHPIDQERIRQNLLAWVDVTTLCIELRKSVLKAKYGIDDDEELTRMVFAEAVIRKEKAWKLMKRSQNISETF
jgi:hypothetical protein